MKKRLIKVTQAIISLLLLVLIIFMIVYVNSLQGTARVVNYTGLVRGETQRLVKLEVTGQQSQDLISDLDGYIDGIQNGSQKLNLVKIDNADFQQKVQDVSTSWSKLKSEIEKMRSIGADDVGKTDIIKISEDHFRLSDDMVSLAEAYSQHLAANVRNFEFVCIFLIAVLLLLIVLQSGREAKISDITGEMREPVFLDNNTNLPNRNKCDEILKQPGPVQVPTVVFLFDLGNLKQVNSNFGRGVGDKMITDFIKMIRTSVPEEHFIGRYGGDKFIVFVTGEACNNADDMVSAIQISADAYNQTNPEAMIRYAVGVAKSEELKEASMQDLLTKAEKDMNQNKKQIKKHTDDFEQEMDASLRNMIQALGREYTDCCYCNAKTGGYHLFGGLTGSNIPKTGMVKTGMKWLSCLIGDREERANFLEKLSIPYISEHLDAKHTSYDVTCHFRGVKRNWWKLTAVYVDSDNGQLHHFLLLFKEISGEKELEFEAKHDGLTGLWNKTTAFELMNEKIREGRKQYSMLICDLDDFKQVNDTMGHSVGDNVIKKTAEILKNQFRDVDVVARFGGDEFFVFADGEPSSDVLKNKANNIMNRVKTYFKQNYNMCDVTVSIGIFITHKHTNTTDLFHEADKALYSAKAQGKNRCVIVEDGEEV